MLGQNQAPWGWRTSQRAISAFRDLGHRVSYEFVTEIDFAHHGFLASNLGRKASAKLGTIQLVKQ